MLLSIVFTGLFVVSFCVVGSAAALDEELLPGTKLLLRQGKKGERLVVVARAGLAAPLPGGAEDPTLTGARVEIGNPATQEWARLEAPANGWSVNGSGTTFRFESVSKDRRQKVLEVVIRHTEKLRISSRTLGITLDEVAQESLAVILTSGTRRYCMLFGGTVHDDQRGRFVARAAPVPSSCPGLPTALPVTSTTSTTRAPRPSSTSTTRTPAPTTSTTRPPDDDDDDDDGDD